FELIDDYGHHPTEVSATLQAVVESRGQKPVVIFEPHRYSRTQLCWQQFVSSFDHVDEVLLCPIYAASENPIEGITSEKLASAINLRHANRCRVLADKDQLFAELD